jgi:amino acid transporter
VAHVMLPPPVNPVAATLKRNAVGAWSIGFFVVAAAAPLTVIGAISQAYATTGFIGIPIAYLVALVVLMAFCVGFLAMARNIGNAGAFYSYVAAGLGRHAGVAAAFVALFTYTLMELGLVGGFASVAVLGLAQAGYTVPWLACALVSWALIGVMGVFGVKINAVVLSVALVAEIVVVVVYDVVLLRHPYQGHYDLAPLQPVSLLAAGGIAVIPALVASYSGFETAVVLREESRGPRTVVRATYWALIITGVLYTVSAWALPVVTGSANIRAVAQADSVQLIFDLVTPYVSTGLVQGGQALILTSLLAAGLAFHNVVARYLYALGRERVLPATMERVGQSGAPKVASRTQSWVVLFLLVLAWQLRADPAVNLYFWATVTAGFGLVLLMCATSVSVVAFFRRRRRLESVWRRSIAPTVAAFLLLLIIGGTIVQFSDLLGLPRGAPLAWIAPAVFGVVAVIGLAWADVLRRFFPDTYAAIGLGAEAAQAQTDRQPVPTRV